jgi:thiol-disulfide isomerase/thioredoxin
VLDFLSETDMIIIQKFLQEGIIMKKTLLLSLFLFFLVLSGCGKEASEQSSGSFGSFSTQDINNNEVTDSVFSSSDLTMVNIWGTFCTPCINEMPDLGELAEEYKDNLQIIGIVTDVLNQDGSYSDEQIALAKEIITQTGADYLHLLPSKDLIELKLKNVSSFPETFFVDKNGNLVGSSYLGSRSKEDWAEIINTKLEEINK